MCKPKPFPRCIGDSYSDWQKASQALIAVSDEKAIREQDPEKLNRLIQRKQDIYNKRDREFSLAAVAGEKNAKANLYAHKIGEVDLTPDEIIKFRNIVQRVEDIRSEPKKLEGVRRERYIRTVLGNYLVAVKKNPKQDIASSSIGGNPKLTYDALMFLSLLTEQQGGRERDDQGKRLTEVEQSALAAARAHIALEGGVEYLPAESTQGKAKNPVLPKGAKSTQPRRQPVLPQLAKPTEPRKQPVPPKGVKSVERTLTPPAPLPTPPVRSLPPRRASLTAPAPQQEPEAPKKRTAGWLDRLLGARDEEV